MDVPLSDEKSLGKVGNKKDRVRGWGGEREGEREPTLS